MPDLALLVNLLQLAVKDRTQLAFQRRGLTLLVARCDVAVRWDSTV